MMPTPDKSGMIYGCRIVESEVHLRRDGAEYAINTELKAMLHDAIAAYETPAP